MVVSLNLTYVLEGRELSCTYLAHHELDNDAATTIIIITIIITTIIIIIIINISIIIIILIIIVISTTIIIDNRLLASQQRTCTAAAYVTMQLFGSEAQRAASIQNVMLKRLRFAVSTAWDAFMGHAHSLAQHISFSGFSSYHNLNTEWHKVLYLPFSFYMSAANP